ncbi:helix-turn-helix domain-containing protein [Oenococcus sicerae]|uniref:Helix-turn-helix domain-containing protein n=1 Tax=Oenococcus sicerae TaxID=2203724 RepID=A0ABX5QN58_9LACO|nr:S24 family peptidase [Oenococcus sicerae]QAS70231.1 helix-turn-helix domain-containing protein [Oenococcus sicerae]
MNKMALNIRKLRDSKHLTQAQFGKLINQAGPTVASWEQGRSKPRMDAAIRISNIFNIKLSELNGDDEIENSVQIENASQNLPVLGRIFAGAPDGVEQDIDGKVAIDPQIISRYGIDNLMALRIDGESMNKVVHNGAIAIINKTDEYVNGDILAVIINGYKGTLKHVFKYDDHIRFEPDSYLRDFQPFEYSMDQIEDDDPTVIIVGKYLYSIDGL